MVEDILRTTWLVKPGFARAFTAIVNITIRTLHNSYTVQLMTFKIEK